MTGQKINFMAWSVPNILYSLVELPHKSHYYIYDRNEVLNLGTCIRALQQLMLLCDPVDFSELNEQMLVTQQVNADIISSGSYSMWFVIIMELLNGQNKPLWL